MGSDCAGTVVKVGAKVTDFAPGDEVYGYKLGGNGTYAEYAAIPARFLALKPASLSFTEAVAIPCAGLTAYEALETLAIQAGETLVITAAAGGVGSFALQIAVHRGARVLLIGSIDGWTIAYILLRATQ